jgi:hypothetical protein
MVTYINHLAFVFPFSSFCYAMFSVKMSLHFRSVVAS